jgi:hypothetical protein
MSANAITVSLVSTKDILGKRWFMIITTIFHELYNALLVSLKKADSGKSIFSFEYYEILSVKYGHLGLHLDYTNMNILSSLILHKNHKKRKCSGQSKN